MKNKGNRYNEEFKADILRKYKLFAVKAGPQCKSRIRLFYKWTRE